MGAIDLRLTRGAAPDTDLDRRMASVVVIGAGISGLACAHGLVRRLPDADVTVVDGARMPGGPLHSHHDAGFVCEDGPNGFLNMHPSTVDLAVEVGLGDDLITGCEAVRRRFVLLDGRLHRFPDRPKAMATSTLLGVRARIRAALEPMIPARKGGREESVAEFAQRRFGADAARALISPMVTGIYAGNAERLSAASALPHLVGIEKRGRSVLMSLLTSRLRARTNPGHPNVRRERLVSFQGGMGQLAGAVADSLGDRLRLQSPVLEVRRDGQGFRVLIGGMRPDELRADVVVSAAPASAAARYLRPVASEAADALAAIPHAPVATVAIGFLEADVPHPLDGFGYLVAAGEGERVIGVYWASSMYPDHRSPTGKVLLQVILGGAHHPTVCEHDDDELLNITCDHLRRVLGIRGAPVMSRIVRHRLGLPQYELGHARRVEAVERAQTELSGLFVTGNALRGIGVNPCTAAAARVAERVATSVESLALARPA